MMKCVICKSEEISKIRVDEELTRDDDILLVELEVLVCQNCGERYYSRQDMPRLEKLQLGKESRLRKIQEVGKIYRTVA